jgi:hypothetical protein
MEICITPIGNAESIGLNISEVDAEINPISLLESDPQCGRQHALNQGKKPKPKSNRKPKSSSKPTSTGNEQIDMTVLFAGTCLAKDSTFNENYDFIQYKMNDVFENWNQLSKKTYFVLKNIEEEEQKQKYGFDQLQRDKYILGDSTVHDELLIDFLREKKIKYDVILLTEAHNLMEVFLEGNEEEKSLFDSDIKQLYDKVKSFYDSFKSGGIMVNIHYKSADKTLFFCSLEDFYTTSSIWSLDVHIFLLKVMKELFLKLEPGIYQKQSDKDVDLIIQKCYQETLEELVKIGTDLISEEGKNEKMVRKIDETFFKNSLEKNKTYFWEKAIFYCMTNLIKNVSKTAEDEDE